MLATADIAEACPGAYNGLPCNPTAGNVCTASGVKYTCDVTITANSQGADVWAVYAPSASWSGGFAYSVWGVDSNNDAFCCQVTDGGLTSLEVLGSSYNDSIAFQFHDGTNQYNLQEHTTMNFDGVMTAGSGADALDGSKANTAYYKDELDGENGNDTILGYEGNDALVGGGNDDTIDGGDGDDVIKGAGGDDTLYGGDGDDRISGGDGNDSIDAEAGDDFACLDNDTGAEVANGGAGNDRLWGNGGNDTLHGDADTDTCDNTSASVNTCESTNNTRPGECPSP